MATLDSAMREQEREDMCLGNRKNENDTRDEAKGCAEHSAELVVWRAEGGEDFDLGGELVCSIFDGVQADSYTLQGGHMEDKARWISVECELEIWCNL